MNFATPRLVAFARLAAGILLAAIVLSACNSGGDDGPVMSDEEKLKTFEKGHNAYGGGGGATPGAASASAGSK